MTPRATDGDDDRVHFRGARGQPAGRSRVVASLAFAVALTVSCAAGAEEPASHRATAEAAERVGKYRTAAREYAAAFEEEESPELLYRLGVCRRRLKLYAPAREAFRSYLRLSPAGALKDDAERQLAQLDVLLDEERRGKSDDEAPPQRQRSTRARRTPPPVEPAPPPAPPAIAEAPQETTAGQSNAAPPAEAAPAPPPVTQPPAQPAPEISAAPAATPPTLTLSLDHPPQPAPAAEAFTEPPSRLRTAAPYVAGSTAVACAALGVYFWAEGSHVSSELDARFAAGALTAADEPRYGRAHAESVAGRVLVAAALAGAAAAVLLWR